MTHLLYLSPQVIIWVQRHAAIQGMKGSAFHHQPPQPKRSNEQQQHGKAKFGVLVALPRVLRRLLGGMWPHPQPTGMALCKRHATSW